MLVTSLQCNYVGCQMTFNPNCAKNAGLFMNVKSVGGKLQHKAYCENHSTGQREKVVIIYLCRVSVLCGDVEVLCTCITMV